MQPAEEPGTAKDKEDASKAKHFILQDQNDIKQQTLALHGGEIKKKKGAMLFCWVHKLLQSERVLRVVLCYRLWHMLDFSSVMSCHTLAHKLTTVQETADGHMKSCMRLFGIRWLEVKLLLLLLHRHFISARHFHLCSRHRNSSNLPHDSYTVIV